MAVDTSARLAILGAGPIGLEAALYARQLGYEVSLFERGLVCQNVLDWGQVRLFTPFAMNASPLGIAAIQAQQPGWIPPAETAHLTGAELVERYFLPLSQTDLLAGSVQMHVNVVSVGREGCHKGELIGRPERGERPFRIVVQSLLDGSEHIEHAEVVIDATGTFGNPNRLGAGGVPAAGESAAAPFIEWGLPEVTGAEREKFAGKHVLIVGAGYSAATNVQALARLAAEEPETRIIWITRRDGTDGADTPIRRIEGDRLPERDQLAHATNELAADGRVTHWAGTAVESIRFDPEQDRFEVETIGRHAGRHVVDRVIANVGYRPDSSLYEELQVHECYATEGPIKLAAALLGEGSADCLDQPSCEPATLTNPEPNFYILGAKSYGRNSQFLLGTGHAQIRDVFAMVTGQADLDLYTRHGSHAGA